MLNALFGLSYGGIIAGTYLIAKLTGAKGGIDVACIGAFLIFLVHVIIWPKLTTQAFFNWKNNLRGFLFGITQIFLFIAQSKAPTSTMLIASIAGALAGAWLGKLILKEHPSWNEVLAMIVAVGGSILGAEGHISASIWAITGGFIQGVTGITARALMRNNASKKGSVGSGYLYLGLVTLLWIAITDKSSSILDVSIFGIIVVGIGSVLSQYAFFHLYKIYNTQKATVFTLLRAPWGVAIESVFLNSGVTALKVLSSAIVFLGALVALYRPKK